MSHIIVKRSRVNNLKDVSVQVPKRKLTIFTGVSGSGKSSLVFDTIGAEGQRYLYDNFSMFVRQFLPSLQQPDADAIENLSMPVIIDQKRLGGGSHSTVGTVTDIAPILRLLFSRVGQPHVGSANMFSFNDPQGMCPDCNGTGTKVSLNLDTALDMNKSLHEGAIRLPDYASNSGKSGWSLEPLLQTGYFDPDKKLADYTQDEMKKLLYSQAQKVKMDFSGRSVNITFEGIVTKFANKYITHDLKGYSERTQERIKPFIGMGPCTLCKGTRLSQAALNCKINNYNIADLSKLQVDDLIEVLKKITIENVKSVLETAIERLSNLKNIGLEYLSLDRETDTLSGGESSRVKIVKHLNGSLVDVMYIFDEPSIGLHMHDVHRLNELLLKLRDQGNTVLVVEHDPSVIKIADHIIDLGPHAGRKGGEIVFQGSFEDLKKADTLTGQHLQNQSKIKSSFRKGSESLKITKAHLNNLKNISTEIPIGVLTVVTGVAGSGKSSLIKTFLQQHPEVLFIDQSAIGTSNRSNTATYIGIMDDIRKEFSKANDVDAGLFSFNSKGACENCQGAGYVTIDLSFMADSKLICEVCEGKRFKEEVLEYKLRGLNITDVLELTIAEALAFFKMKKISTKLQALHDVGLEYLTLGQPLSTLSGGECQRVKLASELFKEGNIIVMDEPTTGLHMSDIDNLLALINNLVDKGNTLIIIEHNMDIIRNADWVIDLGPEGGNKGGEVIFTGTPKDLLKNTLSLTAKYLT